jgi:hypothetical protein
LRSWIFAFVVIGFRFKAVIASEAIHAFLLAAFWIQKAASKKAWIASLRSQ